MKRRVFTSEFKRETVQLLQESGRSVKEVARELGIHPNTLYRWRIEYAEDGEEAFPGHGSLKSGDEEVRRLRRELARVKEERDILKKAVKFFAKESK